MIKRIQQAIALLMCAFLGLPLDAATQPGHVTFNGLPVPGATVTATQGDKKTSVVSDVDGSYVFPDLADGMWTLQVEMPGFTPVTQDITAGANAAPVNLDLKMLPLDQMHAEKGAPVVTGAPAVSANDAKPDAKQQTAAKQAEKVKGNGKNQPSPAQQGAFQRTDVNAAANAPAAAEPPASSGPDTGPSPADLSQRAADGYLINGSSVNGASSAFALNPAIGNNRRGLRSLYNGNIGFTLGNSALDARPYSLTGQDTAKPESTRFTGLFSFGGPLRIPKLIRNGGNFAVNYQWTRNTNGTTATALLPTQDERNGDFSHVLDAKGNPVQIFDPLTGLTGSSISPTEISPQARYLLSLYPLPNLTGNNAYNYQVALLSPSHVDALQSRWGRNAGRRNNLNWNFGMQDSRADNPNLFGFLDNTDSLGYNTTFTWRRTFTNRFFGNFGINFSRYSVQTTPNFDNRVNVSGNAGITGNNQEPVNWGPPGLSFANSGVYGLSDGVFSSNHNQTTVASYDSTWNHGRHNVSFGVKYQWQVFNNLSQQNPRGTFTFTSPGSLTGNDFANFLVGVPQAASIAFGNADKYFRAHGADAYIGDDWKTSPSLTINGALYWQYRSPVTELYGRLVNLDVAQEFAHVAPVVATLPTGSLTGMRYPDSLLHSEKGELMPRIGLSWRPISGSSMLIRAGYGLYYDTAAYQYFATQMAQQSPLSKSLSIQNTAANPLTLANGFYAPPNVITNTFAVDPNFRVGYAQNWQLSMQRDLPASLQMVITYQGIKGTRAPQAFLPNTYAPGGVNPCPTCQAGFTYITSNGNSTREAGVFQLRRRLHNGFTATATYTYAKSIDDTAGLGSAQGAFGAPAQNWLDLSAERGPSNFDQRHQVQLTGQYSSGTGLRGGTLLGGWRGALVKEWTITGNLTMGTGLPFTPIYPLVVPGTSVSQIRPDYTGADAYAGSGVHNLNPLAYIQPAAGQWGNAGRNSLYGPSQFILSASLGRTFRISDRYSLDLRIDSTNPINHVTYTNWNNIVTNPQFGVPSTVAQMRNVVSRVTMRF